MEDARFAPPETTDLIARDPTWLKPARPSRPIAVWLMVAALVLCSLYFGLLWIRAWGLVQTGGMSPVRWVLTLPVLVLLLGLAWGLWRGRGWSRWVGLALILGYLALSIAVSNPAALSAQGPGVLFGGFVLFPGLCLWWVYALALSAKARRYFAKPESSDR